MTKPQQVPTHGNPMNIDPTQFRVFAYREDGEIAIACNQCSWTEDITTDDDPSPTIDHLIEAADTHTACPKTICACRHLVTDHTKDGCKYDWCTCAQTRRKLVAQQPKPR